MPAAYHNGMSLQGKNTILVLVETIPFRYHPNMKYPNRIKELREPTGLSQQDLADAIGTSQPQVNRLENGERELTQTWMFKLSRVLKCDPGALLPADPLGGRNLPVRRISVLGEVKAGAFKVAVEWPPEDRTFYDATIDPAYQDMPVFGLNVVGPSMDKVFPDGCTVECVKLYDLGEEFQAESGSYVVVLRHSPDGLDEWEATIKEYVIDGDGVEWLWPRSNSPEFQTPVRLGSVGVGGSEFADDEVHIWALVIGKHESFPLTRRPR